MKKLFLSLVILFSAGYCHADFNSQFEDWRSTGITVAIDSMFLSSGAIYVKDVTVASGTASDTAQLTMFNSTGTSIGITRSTFPVVLDIDTSGTVYPIDKKFTKGFGLSKTGTSQIYIRYNYLYIIPNGKESLGY